MPQESRNSIFYKYIQIFEISEKYYVNLIWAYVQINHWETPMTWYPTVHRQNELEPTTEQMNEVRTSCGL